MKNHWIDDIFDAVLSAIVDICQKMPKYFGCLDYKERYIYM